MPQAWVTFLYSLHSYNIYLSSLYYLNLKLKKQRYGIKCSIITCELQTGKQHALDSIYTSIERKMNKFIF